MFAEQAPGVTQWHQRRTPGVSPTTCSTNVTALQAVFTHLNRRTVTAGTGLHPAERGIGRPPNKPIVHPAGDLTAVRADSLGFPAPGMHGDHPRDPLHGLDHDPRPMQEQLLNAFRNALPNTINYRIVPCPKISGRALLAVRGRLG